MFQKSIITLPFFLNLDESFTEAYKSHSLVFKGLWEPLFFEVELKDEAPNVELFLENCWMTQSEEINSIPHWNFIADGQVTLQNYL